MKKQLLQFSLRILMNAAGLWLSATLISGINFQNKIGVLIGAALVLSIVNVFVKPIIVILSLPALVLTLGIFSVVINGFMVWLAHLLYPPFNVANFRSAILAGIIIGLVNYVLTQILGSDQDSSGK